MLGSDGPVLDPDRVAVGQGMRPRHDVAGAEDVGVADGRQRRVAFEPGIQLQAAAGQPLGVRERAQPDDDEVRGDARTVGQLDRLDPSGAVQCGDARSEAQIDAVVAVQRGAPFAQLRAQRQHRRRGDVDQRHVEALLAGGLGDLAPDESRAHDRYPRALLERGSQRDPVVEVAQDVDALQLAAGARPASRPGPGRQDQPVVRDLVAVGEHHPPPRAVQARRRHAQAPLRVERVRGEVDALDLVLTGKHVLRQRRPRVRQVGLVAHHHQISVEPCGSRSLRRPQPGERCPDDDYAAQLAGSLRG